VIVGFFLVQQQSTDASEPERIGNANAPDDRATVHAAGAGGVQRRDADEAVRRRQSGAVRVAHVPELPTLPAPPPEAIPDFKDKAEEIAYYERKLEVAKRSREQRLEFINRLPQAQRRAEQSDDPEAARANFERTRDVVEKNYRIADDKVKELERKLAQLRG
jgi:hypothetical protein